MSQAVELVHVIAGDGCRLDGIWQRAATVEPEVRPFATFLLVHGTGSNFYAPGVLERFAALAQAAGFGTLRINTRGHDGLCHLPGKPNPGGAAFDRIADCTLDLAAWIEFLASHDCHRIGLVGHSLGGVKCLYYAAQQASPEVAAVIAISPPRFCHRLLRESAAGPAFEQEFAHAQGLVAQGQGGTLFSVTQPLRLLISAASYLEKYGPADHYDFVPWLSHTRVPVLILLGEKTVLQTAAFAGLPAALAGLQLPPERVQVEMISGAEINFQADPDLPFQRTAAWLAKISPRF